MKITRIENQKKRPGRKNIFADGQFLLGVSRDTLLRFGLRTGDEITPETLRRIEQAEELLGARTAALRLLALRPRTEREIRDALREKEFSGPTALETIAHLKDAGLLDDAAFARSFVRNALALKGGGRILLRRKLLLLGVDARVADEALEETLRDVDEEEEAMRAAEGFLTRRRLRAGPKLRRQLAAFLARRGYGWDIVAAVVKKALQAEHGEGETL